MTCSTNPLVLFCPCCAEYESALAAARDAPLAPLATGPGAPLAGTGGVLSTRTFRGAEAVRRRQAREENVGLAGHLAAPDLAERLHELRERAQHAEEEHPLGARQPAQQARQPAVQARQPAERRQQRGAPGGARLSLSETERLPPSDPLAKVWGGGGSWKRQGGVTQAGSWAPCMALSPASTLCRAGYSHAATPTHPPTCPPARPAPAAPRRPCSTRRASVATGQAAGRACSWGPRSCRGLRRDYSCCSSAPTSASSRWVGGGRPRLVPGGESCCSLPCSCGTSLAVMALLATCPSMYCCSAGTQPRPSCSHAQTLT